jgi:2-succinyl-5-enolpyruvyl-6-hydroxy-3-cyclohexene-1-carboxylate synthase
MQHSTSLAVKELPDVKAIMRITMTKNEGILKEKVSELVSAQKILIIAGQNTPSNARKIEKCLSEFFKKFNCVIHTEHMANLRTEGTINLSALGSFLSHNTFETFLPDIVISFGGNIGVYGLKGLLRQGKYTHWLINENGAVVDPFKNTSIIFECSALQFFEYFSKSVNVETRNNKIYYNTWLSMYQQIKIPSLPWSNTFVIQQFLQKMPDNSLLHLSILNSIRISHFFELPTNTMVYANIGTDGIDGTMSSFLGQASATNCLSFLIIGDLSFFYDMGSISIRHIKNNARILLINNHGGGEFYLAPRPETLDRHIAAKHNTSAKGWIEQVGFYYLSARSKNEYLTNLSEFITTKSEYPVIFEVFTDMENDADAVNGVIELNQSLFNKNAADSLKRVARSILDNNAYAAVKTVAKKIIKK